MRIGMWIASLVLFVGPSLRASTVEESLAKMAGDIKTYAESKNVKDVRIEGFRGTGEFATSGGPYLVQKLTEVLQARGIGIAMKSRIILSGDYDEVEDKETQTQAVRVQMTIKDKDEDKEIKLERRFVRNQTEIARVLGLTLEFPPNANKKERNDELKGKIDEPKPAIQGSVLRAKANSKFGIEILVKEGNDYKPRSPEEKDKTGLAFVGIKRNEVYAVRLINDNPFDVAVQLTLDGLGMFVSCDAVDPDSKRPLRDPLTKKPLFQHVLIPANQSMIVKGWFVNLKKTDEFKVTAYADSLAHLFNSGSGVGTITAEFHAAVAPDKPFPDGEPKNNDNVSLSADATGRGKRLDEEYGVKEVKIGGLRGAVSVRYTR